MKEWISSISRPLIQQLPDKKEFLTLRELQELEYPAFVTRQVEILLQERLRESLVFPDSEWVNRNKPSVQRSWQTFSDSLMAEVRLPVSLAPELFEEAVGNLLNVLLTPREAIPQRIFGESRELTRSELEERATLVTVFRHLAQAPVRYMERKELETLTLNQCRTVISRVDEKLAFRYDAEEWTDLVTPLFQLADGRVESDLLRLFFRDKGFGSVARSFELLNRAISRREFREMISSFDLPPELTSSGKVPAAESPGPKTLFERFSPSGEKEPETARPEPDRGAVNQGVAEQNSVTESDPGRLYSLFMSGPVTEEDPEDEDPGENAIWKRFVQAESEPAEMKPVQPGRNKVYAAVPGQEAGEAPDTTASRKRMEKRIGGSRDRFINDLFRGSEEEYQKVITGLAGIGEWKQAADFIETEVFDRYGLDLTDDVAIDFTDLMHSCFLEEKPEKSGG